MKLGQSWLKQWWMRGAIAGLSLLAVNLMGSPAQAADRFDNGAVEFEVDTIVEFEFLESRGLYQSTFGVINLTTGEKTPLIQEVRPSDRLQRVVNPADLAGDAGNRDDSLGSPGNAVMQPLAEFEFKANTPYAFYLESFYNGRSAGIFYSTNERNPGDMQRVRFDNTEDALATGGITLSWDDTGSLLVRPQQQDQDFDDFTVRAGGHLECPWQQ